MLDYARRCYEHVARNFRYIEGYGWIPLDAQYKNSNPRGNYFGVYDGQCVVVMQDFTYDFGISDLTGCDILQTYYYWYWEKSGPCQITDWHLFMASY